MYIIANLRQNVLSLQLYIDRNFKITAIFLASFWEIVNQAIVIRNGKIVSKVVWIEYYLRMNFSSRGY